ncbi:cytochrome b [Leucothrix arctica]|uniref:Cytochrome b n=1 Tax=Leucothrix arctica TaxID=1481894 RepID=A0A317CK47_9GAMM|nr:cytochrome B [Leucothrix arctica]
MNGLLNWIDARFPLTDTWNKHIAEYYAPKNFNFFYFFGSLAMLVLVLQIVTGVFLTMHYKPDIELAFASVEHIMRDVPGGWFIRYMHSTGASMFFIVVYLHMFRGLIYGSFKGPRELVWLIGMLIYLALMAEAFMGYMLPWGQMSFWGAQVIINLFNTIPYVGEIVSQTIRGDFVISDPTLNRFFAFHVIAVPLILVGLVFVHIVALHQVGSNNPDGVDIKQHKDENGIPLDGIPFHPYYTVKDIVGVVGFFIVFFAILFFMPEGGGYFLEYPNFEPANPLKTPEHIAPVWYFTPFYTVLRAVPDPFLGTLAMFAAIAVLFVLPWLDKNPIKSIRYRNKAHYINLVWFCVAFVVLGVLGVKAVTPFLGELGIRCTQVYFLFFAVTHAHSRPMKVNYVVWFAVLFGITIIWDLTRYADLSGESVAIFWQLLTVPFVYLLSTLILPMFVSSFNKEKEVPTRVTG